MPITEGVAKTYSPKSYDSLMVLVVFTTIILVAAYFLVPQLISIPETERFESSHTFQPSNF